MTIAASLATTQVGYTQFGTLPRILSLNEVFLCVRFKKFSIVPVSLAAAQFLELAGIPRHLPYNPDTADGVPPAPANLATLATLPGYRKWNQGNGNLSKLAIRLRAQQMRVDRFLTDQPSLLDLVSYAGSVTVCNCTVTAHFSGLKYDQ